MSASAWAPVGRLLVSRIAAALLEGPEAPAPALPAQPAEDDERLLTPDEAARLLGVTKRWLYRHSRELPFARKLSRKCLRFSLRGLRRWQERQRP